MGTEPRPLCLVAATELQHYLQHNPSLNHNFGLNDNKDGAIIGKMFGVLVVETEQHEIGYIAAFSGKLGGSNVHEKFVPPVYDALTENSFLNEGMKKLAQMSEQIKMLAPAKDHEHDVMIKELKTARKNYSKALQNQLFDQYHFLNEAGKEKSLRDLFTAAGHKQPPSAAGECAGPKLLQYAFQQKMRPLALAEFWWGLSPKSASWKHGEFYACCQEKCAPILVHMLSATDHVYD